MSRERHWEQRRRNIKRLNDIYNDREDIEPRIYVKNWGDNIFIL
jgi:hypothetical protein